MGEGPHHPVCPLHCPFLDTNVGRGVIRVAVSPADRVAALRLAPARRGDGAQRYTFRGNGRLLRLHCNPGRSHLFDPRSVLHMRIERGGESQGAKAGAHA